MLKFLQEATIPVLLITCELGTLSAVCIAHINIVYVSVTVYVGHVLLSCLYSCVVYQILSHWRRIVMVTPSGLISLDHWTRMITSTMWVVTTTLWPKKLDTKENSKEIKPIALFIALCRTLELCHIAALFKGFYLCFWIIFLILLPPQIVQHHTFVNTYY